MSLRFGENRLHMHTNCTRMREIREDNIHVMDGYKPGEAYNDVALIYVEEAIKFGETVNPICLPTEPIADPDTLVEQHMHVPGEKAV